MRMHSSLSLVALAVLALGATAARAESTYGYNTAGTGTVTATAKLNISVVVPKVVVLRVGTAGSTQDSLTYNTNVAIPAAPTNVTGDATASSTSGNAQAVTWSGAAPTVTVSGSAPTAAAYAWSNAATITVTCSATLSTGGPTLANIGVTSPTGTGQNFAHPGTDLSACNGSNSTSLTNNTLYTNTWTYTLDGTNAGTWPAGNYTGSVTYTATGT